MTGIQRGVAAIGASMAFLGGAEAATIRVPEDQPSVLLGVDAAARGDTVLVGPGTWSEKDTRIQIEQGFPTEITACAFPQYGITIRGEPGASSTILDLTTGGPGSNRNVTFVEAGPGVLTLEGLTLTGSSGAASRTAVAVVDSEGLIVRSCRFLGNLDGVEDAAILGGTLSGQGEFEVYSSTFENFDSLAGAIFLLYSSLRAEDCRFQNNFGKCIQVDAEYALGADVAIERCEFIDNRGSGFGVGIDLVAVQNFTIRESLFLRNVAEDFAGAAIRLEVCSGDVEFNVFAYDSVLVSNGLGAGVRWGNTEGRVRNNTFVGCHSVLNGSCFSGAFGGVVEFENNLIAHATGGAAVNASGTGFITNLCNLYWANTGGDYGNWPPFPADLHADPLFCDLDQLDFTVQDDSPCIVGGCDQIGALGVGCTKVSVEPMSWGRIKGLYRVER